MILDVDLSQIEWRICAVLSQDPIMLEEIRSGIDQHAATCTSPDMMNLPLTKDNRTDAKIFNFRAIYCNPSSASYAYFMDPKMPDFPQKRWEAILEGFFKKYSGMGAWHNEIIKQVRKTGELRGPTGRIWKFDKQQQKGGWYDYSVAQIRNYPVQGTAGDLIKLAMVYIEKRRRQARLLKSKLMIGVHDCLVWDTPEEEAYELAEIAIRTFREIPELVKRHFNFDINCPITGEAELGPSWGTMKGLHI